MRCRNHGGKRRSFFSGIASTFGRRCRRQPNPERKRAGRGGVDRTNPLQHRLRLEPLEDRRMLTVFLVDSLADTVADDGVTTLREAIQAANTNTELWGGAVPAGSATETDVIRFAESLFTDGENPVARTITLGGTQLSISGKLDIEGPGADLLSIDANQMSRVFSIGSGEATLSGLTITGGSASTGGGITNSGILTVTGSTISGNSTTGSSGQGGGVYNTRTLTVINSVVSGNSAKDGGGVYGFGSTGSISISNSTIAGNSATAPLGVAAESTPPSRLPSPTRPFRTIRPRMAGGSTAPAPLVELPSPTRPLPSIRPTRRLEGVAGSTPATHLPSPARPSRRIRPLPAGESTPRRLIHSCTTRSSPQTPALATLK